MKKNMWIFVLLIFSYSLFVTAFLEFFVYLADTHPEKEILLKVIGLLPLLSVPFCFKRFKLYITKKELKRQQDEKEQRG